MLADRALLHELQTLTSSSSTHSFHVTKLRLNFLIATFKEKHYESSLRSYEQQRVELPTSLPVMRFS
jgi:hypothetical protein